MENESKVAIGFICALAVVACMAMMQVWSTLVDSTWCREGYKYHRVDGKVFQVISENGGGVTCK